MVNITSNFKKPRIPTSDGPAGSGINGTALIKTMADNDGAFDWAEGFDANGDGNAADDMTTLASIYETNNGNPGDYDNTDTDTDGIPDWMDNQPTIPGYIENTKPPFLVQSSIYWVTANNNGLAGIFDEAVGGSLAPVPDQNSVNDKDWRDENTATSLPVELIRFTAQKDGCAIYLKWIAASEINFSHYQIERSVAGRNFTKIATQQASGSTALFEYSYIDNNADAKNYYRLKMVDLDGSFEYSAIVAVNLDCKKVHSLSVYPNPVNQGNLLNVHILAELQTVQLQIIGLTGKIVREDLYHLQEGDNNILMETSDLPLGNYLLLVTTASGTATRQLNISKK